MNEKEFKTILFAGGGTAGSATPLIAVFDELKKQHSDYIYHWVGTKNGPEKELVEQKGIGYSHIVTAKMDRFFSFRNFFSPFLFIVACWQSLGIIAREQPDMIVAAGGFVAVPLVWVAWLFKIPCLIHQLDVRVGLANKLMSPFAKTITLTFEKSLRDFPKSKSVWSGGPVRNDLFEVKTERIPVHKDLPVILVFGGGTGAQAINELVWASLDDLIQRVQVIHLTGKGKGKDIKKKNYYQYQFLSSEMAEAYHKADVVVTRAGLGTFLELAALQKSAVVIPLPGTHQEDNAQVLKDTNSAMVLHESYLRPQIFAAKVIGLVENSQQRQVLAANISDFYKKDAVKVIIEKILNILYN